MDAGLALRLSIQLVLMFGGIIIFMVVTLIVTFKMRARNKWYCEFNRNGQMLYELHEDNEDGEIITTHGTYYLPRAPRMRIGWPLGLPTFIQENVYHEKFILGNPEPIEFPGEDEDLNLALYIKEVNQASKDVLVSVNESLASFSGNKNTLILASVIGIAVVGVIALVGAYYAYQASGDQEAVLRALGAL